MRAKLEGHQDHESGACDGCVQLVPEYLTVPCPCGGRVHLASKILYPVPALDRDVTLVDFCCSKCGEDWTRAIRHRLQEAPT